MRFERFADRRLCGVVRGHIGKSHPAYFGGEPRPQLLHFDHGCAPVGCSDKYRFTAIKKVTNDARADAVSYHCPAALGWKAAMAAVDEPFAFSVVIVFRRTANLLLIS